MSDYSLIDPVLTAWARQKGVHVLTHHWDTEVRSVMIYGLSNQTGHLWIDRIDASGMVGVHAAASDGFRLDRLAPISGLANVVDEVYDALASQVGAQDIDRTLLQPSILRVVGDGSVDEFKATQIRFWREQGGQRDCILKRELGAMFEQHVAVRSACLALVDYGENTHLGVALCLDSGAGQHGALRRKIQAIFRSVFDANERLDVLFMTSDQINWLRTVCPPFYQQEISQRRSKPS